MFKNFGLFGWVVAGVLGAVLFSGAVALGPAPGSFSTQQKGSDRQFDQTATKPRTIEQQKPTEEEKYCPAGERRNDCVIQLRTALATEQQARYAWYGFVALVFTLLLSTIATLAATSSARTARKVLTDLERPHIFVEVVKAGLRWETGDGSYRLAAGRFEHKCVNYGRTPAALTEYLPKVLVLDAGNFPAPINPLTERGRELPAGCVASERKPYVEGETAMKTFDWKLLNPGASQKYSIYFIGYIRYRDMILGAPYINGFCFLYDEIGGRFVRRGDNERYNYTKREEQPPVTLVARLRAARKAWREAAHGRAA